MEILRALEAFYRRNRRLVLTWGGIGGAVFVLPLLGLMLLPQILGLFAPKLDLSKDLYSVNRPIAYTFLDADGRVAGHRGAIVGERLALGDMPPYLPAAFIAMEDRSFWSNSGISVRGLIRAAWEDIHAGHVVAGGSTITQQTAKIVFTSQERTLSRKIKELFETAALNKSLSKKQILELYLNRIYLGSGAYGVDGAAHVYFGKSARELTLPEAAMLATLTTAPSVFSPRRDLARAQARAVRVLRAMVQTGAITESQADQAASHPAAVTDRTIADARNYYFDTAADEANRLVTVNGKLPGTDLIVHTAFEPRIEDAARKAIANTLNKNGARLHASQAAAVVMKTDGAVAALIGGRDYDESVFNRATLAHRQPGSAFKPFVYLTALENGISPWDVRDDGPVDIDGWTPTNYGGREYGTVTIADALAHSINTITAGLAQEVGITNVVEAAHRCGIVSPLEPNASLALGTSEVTPLELTAAYATFATGGMKVTPYFVTEVDDNAGHILYKRVTPAPERIVASHVNRDMLAMLYGVVQEGTGRRASIAGHETAGKTGTTQDYHDAWFVGFTTDYVAGVWVGNDDSSPMRGVTGGSLPAEIWNGIMTVAETGLPSTPLDMSEPETPADLESGAIIASGGANGAAITDDEAVAPAQVEDRRSFWDWLFGRRPQAQQQQDEQQRSDDQDGGGDNND
jgi:penicillin-binding protein 1A